MSENVVTLDSVNFKSITGRGVCVVDFWAPWCGPCKSLGPIMDTLSSQLTGKATIAKLDIDSEPQLAREYSIRSVPTILIMKDGDVVRQMVGTQTLQSILSEVRKLA